MRIEHLAFNLIDPLAAVDWYCEHLDLGVIAIRREAPAGAFLTDGGGMRLELYAKPQAEPMPLGRLSADTFHLAFVTDDLIADHARLAAAGATALGEIETTPRGDLLAFLRDPFGLCIQLAQRMSAQA